MRDQLLATVRARLDRIEAAQDLAPALEPGVLDEAQRLADILREDDDDLEARFTLGWLSWYRYLGLPKGQDRDALVEATQAFAPCFIMGVERLPKPLIPLLAKNATGTAVTVLQQALNTSDLTLLTTAVSLWQRILTATPADHPNRAGRLFNLGNALQARFGRSGVPADLGEAIRPYAQAAEVESGAPSIRIRAARVAASLGGQTDAQTSANLLERAVRLLPQTAPRQLHRDDQQYSLGQFAGLASDAAALALRADAPSPSGDNPATRALRLLELGRGVLLSQALDTRSELTDLEAHDTALAARFRELRDQLDQPGDTTVSADDAGMAAGWVRPVEDRHQRAAAFQATVAEIRNLDGFETFLLPPEPDQLLRHAHHGPVVLVNVSQYRSDAILLTPDGIASVPLPDLAQNDLIAQIVSFHQALSTAHDHNVSFGDRIRAQHTLSAVLEWLWDPATQPILNELGYRHTPAAGAGWPRLWWVSGGLLGFLPVHAAGYHRESPGPDGGRRTVLDRVISSYTPTVRALGYARERTVTSRAGTSSAGDRALIVAMPTTPGIDSPLSHVADEAELVRTRLPGATLLIEDPATTNPELPTKATVLAHLGDCAIAHFACHGHSHPSDPSLSLLLLHDHDTDPLTVASLAPIRLDHARLAYLSACHTAFNAATDLIDEAIHLTTAFQLAGYPHVVGTLWEIDDALAVHVADSFYTTLTTGAPPPSTPQAPLKPSTRPYEPSGTSCPQGAPLPVGRLSPRQRLTMVGNHYLAACLDA